MRTACGAPSTWVMADIPFHMVRSLTITLLLVGLPIIEPGSAVAGEPAAGSPTARHVQARVRNALAPAVPPSLEHLESAAEDIGDAVAAGNWPKATRLVGAAERDLDALAEGTRAGDVAQARSHLDETRKAVESRRPIEAQFAANAVSGDVVDLFGKYQPIVPVEVMRLDVLLRRVQLEGLARTPARAASPLKEARRLWTKLEGHPPLQGTPAARRFDRELMAVEAASAAENPSSLEQTAGVALEGVDRLEQVFAPASK